MEKIKKTLKEYADELLYKVHWPTLEELQSSTITVLIASLIVALLIALMDFVFKFSVGGLYSLFG